MKVYIHILKLVVVLALILANCLAIKLEKENRKLKKNDQYIKISFYFNERSSISHYFKSTEDDIDNNINNLHKNLKEAKEKPQSLMIFFTYLVNTNGGKIIYILFYKIIGLNYL